MGERGGLDMLVANLLSQMGLTVLTTPIRGSKQYGVDVAAVGKLLDEDADQTIYLFSIKSGDIGRENLDVGKQALRPSIDEIVDAMAQTGALMSPMLKESSQAGLATTKTGLKIKKKIFGTLA